MSTFPSPPRRPLVLALVVLAIGVGAALKAVRYAGTATVDDTASVALVTAHLTAWGWRAAGPAETRASGLYTSLELVRDGCATPLRVALLGASPEAAHLVRRDLGDVAFVQDGMPRAWPSAWRRQVGELGRALGALVGHARTPAPLLALAPPPRSGEPCRGPDAETWRGLGTPERRGASSALVTKPSISRW